MPRTERSDVVVRPAVPDDAAAVADVHLLARSAAPMPPAVHTDDEVRSWLAVRLQEDECWVAVCEGEAGDEVVGYLRMTPTWLDDLYVLPAWAGQGIGSLLLDVAVASRPDGFGLWVFESNLPARAFYAHRGLVEVRRTDGSENEEGAPDIEMALVPTPLD